MRYQVRKSIVDVVGHIWMPNTVCSLHKTLSGYDLENMRDEDGNITRDSLEQWLCMNTGDFQDIIDFSASIEDGDKTIDIPWLTEDGEMQYLDTLGDGE